MCSLLPPPNNGMLLAILSIKPVPIGSYRDQTSSQFYSRYRVGPGKILLFNLLSSTFSWTVFFFNVFGIPPITALSSACVVRRERVCLISACLHVAGHLTTMHHINTFLFNFFSLTYQSDNLLIILPTFISMCFGNHCIIVSNCNEPLSQLGGEG